MPRRPPTSPRKKPRQQRSQATVDCILYATARVLCSTGYDRASTNRIALAAGVSVGSLYQYFPSKEALVAGLAERHTAAMTSLIKEKLAEVASQPLDAAIRTVIQAMFDAHAVDPKLHKVLIEEVPRVGKLQQVVRVEREVEAMVIALLEARRKDLRRTKLGATSFVLCHVVEAVTHAAVLFELEEPRRSEVAAELTDLLLRYLPASQSPALY